MSEAEVYSCLKKMCPTNYSSGRPDGSESLGEPQEQIANQFAASIEAPAMGLQLIQLCEQPLVPKQVHFIKY